MNYLVNSAPTINKLIKLGGAAITDKSELETPSTAVIRAVAQHVAQAYQKAVSDNKGSGMVIVHGAGSFGHHQACQYGVQHGWGSTAAPSAYVRSGFAATRASVMKLNCMVVDALIAEGLPAVGISAFSSGWMTCGRSVVQDGCAAVRACLEAGLLPVLHGDCVLDTQLGCTILSGDTIMRRLAEVLHVEHAVFLTNVPGVFDQPPENVGARLLPEITVQPDGGWHVEGMMELSASPLDATGGIAKKIEEAAVIAALGIDVVIAQAGTEDGRLACLASPQELQERQCSPAHVARGQEQIQAVDVGLVPTGSQSGGSLAAGLAACSADAMHKAVPGHVTSWKGTIVRLAS